MIRPEVAAEIVRLFSVEGWKVGTIARHLCVHHSTVARALERHGLLGERKCRRSMIDSFVPFIRDTFERYPRLPASVLYRMVRARGYSGGEDHFRHRVALLRPRRAAEAYLELRTLPGEQAQVDWASFGTRAVEGGQRRQPPGPGAQVRQVPLLGSDPVLHRPEPPLPGGRHLRGQSWQQPRRVCHRRAAAGLLEPRPGRLEVRQDRPV